MYNLQEKHMGYNRLERLKIAISFNSKFRAFLHSYYFYFAYEIKKMNKYKRFIKTDSLVEVFPRTFSRIPTSDDFKLTKTCE